MIANSKNLDNQIFSDEVDRVVALSPCAIVNKTTLALGNEDIETILQFSETINYLFEYTQYFGPNFIDELNASPVPTGFNVGTFNDIRDFLI